MYFNVIKAVRLIFNELEYQFSTTTNSLEAPEAVQNQISELRNKLLPLTSLQDTLASHLNGGVVIGSGKAFVRTGWQSLVGGSDTRKVEVATRADEVSMIAAKALASSLNDIQTLWSHPTVKLFHHDGKIRLEDSATL